jgi:diketogulonate reductase-like aldo/keto reductase
VTRLLSQPRVPFYSKDLLVIMIGISNSYHVLVVIGLLPTIFTASIPPRVEIAPSVWMPRLTLNAYPNTSSWLNVGGRSMDCALDYGSARQTEMGRAVASSGLPRSELFITTKVPCCPKAHFGPSGWPFLPVANCTTPRNTSTDIESDLEVIGVNYVDLLLLHFTCGRWEDTLQAWRVLEAAALSGRARAIGVSNFNRTDIDRLVAAAHIPPAVNQAGFAIGSPQNATLGRDWGTINRCQELNITYEAYAPFGERNATAPTSRVDVLNDPTVMRVAAKLNTSTALVGLRWIIQHGMNVVTSSANSLYQQDDLLVFDFELSPADMATLDAV